jgi:hypothetical protein
MRKSKDITVKEIMPSTTRGNTNLPSRPRFSPANATPAIKNKSAALHSSPLSKMSMPTDNDNELSNDSMDDEVTNDSSNPSSNKNSDMDRETIKSNAIKALSRESIAAFSRAFVEGDLNDFDEFDSLIHTSIGDLFPLVKKPDAPIVYKKDPAYKFSVNTEAIEWVGKRKFYGRNDEYQAEHMLMLHEISNLHGNDEVQKHYYFLKLFPFSLGDDAKTWYHSLALKSITSKDSCIRLFCDKIFPVATIHAMKIDICKFTQRKEESIPQAWERLSHMTMKCHAHGLKDNELLDTFYNGLTNASRSYIDSIACNIFRNSTIKEAKELLDKMAKNYDKWTLNEEDDTEGFRSIENKKFPPKTNRNKPRSDLRDAKQRAGK